MQLGRKITGRVPRPLLYIWSGTWLQLRIQNVLKCTLLGRQLTMNVSFLLLSLPPCSPLFPGWVEFPLAPADLWDSSRQRELSLSHLTFLLNKTLARWLLGIWSPEGAGPAEQLGGWPVPQNHRESRLFVNIEGKYSPSPPGLPLLYPTYHLPLYISLIKGQETQRKSQTIWMRE